MKRSLYILLLSCSMAACTEELEQVTPNFVSQDTFWKTENDVLSGIAATYKTLKQQEYGYWAVRGVEITNGRGDDFFIRNDVKDLYQLSTFTNNATTGSPANLFAIAYRGVFRANQVIENVPNAQISDEAKAQFIAEAKFLRALNYFHLAINFGAVPLITAAPKERKAYFVKQSPEEQIWKQVESDLAEAKAGLPVSYPAKWVGRATKGAATGYLAKAYVYQKKWAEAEQEFKLLVQPSGQAQAPFSYDLLAVYEHNFMKEHDNNQESLFEIQNQHVGGAQPWAGENANESMGSTTAQEFAPTEVGGWFEAFPSNKMFNAFQKEKTVDGDFDPRMYASIVWDYPEAKFYQKSYSAFEEVFGMKSRIKKYQNHRDVNEGIWISEINEKALRYADILLMYAETLTMQDRTPEAYPLVNRIRNRAKLADLTPGFSQAQMMAEIRHQRMVEFFREGLRFYDLKRWGLLEQEIANSDKEGRQFFNQSRHAYFPIPQDELNTNPNIEQNPNW
jgi:tetratricopeptide (TPR) repeat protein